MGEDPLPLECYSSVDWTRNVHPNGRWMTATKIGDR